jgi:hypothetical protein
MRGALALLVCASACNFSTRSDEFACDRGGGCDDGRTCVDGWCVAPSSVPSVDADVGPFTCDDSGCRLECGDDMCGAVRCPDGRPCTVECVGSDSCSGEVDCGNATTCTIVCSGVDSCGGGVDCGEGRCDVDCSGDQSCAASVDCDDACACDLDCTGTDSCGGSNQCPRQQCLEGNECVTTGGNCDQC